MQWFRAHLRLGARLAIFALAAQMVLSFGHVHRGSFARAVPLASSSTQSSPAAPTQPPASDADQCCAICATIHLTGSSFLPEQPQLRVPFASGPVEHFKPSA